MTPPKTPFLDYILRQAGSVDLPPNYDLFGWKLVRPDLTAYGGNRWPFPGGTVVDPGAKRGGSPHPTKETGGYSIALDWRGANLGGHGSTTALLLAYRRVDILAKDDHTVRVKDARVIEVIDVHRLLTRFDMTEADLSGADLAGANLNNAHFSHVSLKGAKLQGASLLNANLTGSILVGIRAMGADLTGADLSGTEMPGANLTGANLAHVYLTGANLSGAILKGADLTGVGLEDASLAGANLIGANLAGANLRGADLSGADLTGAALVNARNLDQAIGMPDEARP